MLQICDLHARSLQLCLLDHQLTCRALVVLIICCRYLYNDFVRSCIDRILYDFSGFIQIRYRIVINLLVCYSGYAHTCLMNISVINVLQIRDLHARSLQLCLLDHQCLLGSLAVCAIVLRIFDCNRHMISANLGRCILRRCSSLHVGVGNRCFYTCKFLSINTGHLILCTVSLSIVGILSRCDRNLRGHFVDDQDCRYMRCNLVPSVSIKPSNYLINTCISRNCVRSVVGVMKLCILTLLIKIFSIVQLCSQSLRLSIVKYRLRSILIQIIKTNLGIRKLYGILTRNRPCQLISIANVSRLGVSSRIENRGCHVIVDTSQRSSLVAVTNLCRRVHLLLIGYINSSLKQLLCLFIGSRTIIERDRRHIVFPYKSDILSLRFDDQRSDTDGRLIVLICDNRNRRIHTGTIRCAKLHTQRGHRIRQVLADRLKCLNKAGCIDSCLL